MESILISFYAGMVALLGIMVVYSLLYMIWDCSDCWKDILKWIFGVLAFVFVSYELGHFIIRCFGLM